MFHLFLLFSDAECVILHIFAVKVGATLYYTAACHFTLPETLAFTSNGTLNHKNSIVINDNTIQQVLHSSLVRACCFFNMQAVSLFLNCDGTLFAP